MKKKKKHAAPQERYGREVHRCECSAMRVFSNALPANRLVSEGAPFVDVQRVSLRPLLLTILMKPCVTTDKVHHYGLQ